MVRVGGGWVALDEFLVKNDPCRGKLFTNFILKKKRTNFNFSILIKENSIIERIFIKFQNFIYKNKNKKHVHKIEDAKISNSSIDTKKKIK